MGWAVMLKYLVVPKIAVQVLFNDSSCILCDQTTFHYFRIIHACWSLYHFTNLSAFCTKSSADQLQVEMSILSSINELSNALSIRKLKAINFIFCNEMEREEENQWTLALTALFPFIKAFFRLLEYVRSFNCFRNFFFSNYTLVSLATRSILRVAQC